MPNYHMDKKIMDTILVVCSTRFWIEILFFLLILETNFVKWAMLESYQAPFVCCFGVQLSALKIEEANMFTCWKGVLP
jgi:hypothetical protein